MKKLLKSMVVILMLAAMMVPTAFAADRTKVNYNKISGQAWVMVGDNNSITYKSSSHKLTIKGTLYYGKSGKKSPKKTHTFKVNKKLNFYAGEDFWYAEGTVGRTTFLKQVRRTCGKYHFPTTYIWTKDGKIISCGCSA